MENNKLKIALICMVFLFAIMPMISARPPVTTEFIGDTNLVIEANAMPYYKINEGTSIFIHVFNKSNGVSLDNTQVSCEVELTNHNGTLLLSGTPTYTGDYWTMTRPSTIITERGKYAVIIHCNSSVTAGYKTFFFQANGFGDELDTAHSIKFNASMFFMLAFLLLFVTGIFVFKNPLGKMACYFTAHLIFIAGNFAIWQFNNGYTTQFTGSAVVWEIMFYFSTIALFPMILIAIAGMIIYYATGKEITRLIDHGMSEDEAIKRQGRKFK